MTESNKLLTISIAAYRVEKYLPACIESMLVEDEDMLNRLEILVINDGSGEGINSIARRYEKKYPNVVRMIDKENGGHGSTVNKGIECASGEYFKVVDGDDLVQTENLLELLRYIEKQVVPSNAHSVDMIVSDYVTFLDGTEYSSTNTNETYKKCCVDDCDYRVIYEFDKICDKGYFCMHSLAYRTELIRQAKMKLSEHCFYVDSQYCSYFVPYIKTIAFFEKPIYRYRLGLLEQSMNLTNMQKNCSHHEKVLQTLLDNYDRLDNCSEPKKRYLERAAARIVASQYKIYLSYDDVKKYKRITKTLDKKIKDVYPKIYKANVSKPVQLLRATGFILFGTASRLVRKDVR